MTLTRRDVTRDHVLPLAALAVAPEQDGLVAENMKTLAQAAHEPGAAVWGLWAGGTPVGLLAMIDPRRTPHLDEGDDPAAAYLWRLMIDAGWQGRGFGRQALAEAVAVARAWNLPRLTVSVVDRPGGPLSFYEGAGFRRTGRIAEGEVVLVRDV